MLRYLTAGESHGESLLAILENFPAGIKIDIDYINQKLKERQGGFGSERIRPIKMGDFLYYVQQIYPRKPCKKTYHVQSL